LSTHLKEKLEKIEQILTQIAEESAKGIPIVVEGTKDAEALRDLGICGTIVTVKTCGKSFLQANVEIESLRQTEIILLLDFDRRGREGTKRLQKGLERVKIKMNLKFWSELNGLVGREIQSIESLNAYLSTLRKKTSYKL
jgi:5S rRNA maturation endonuclease (ribonuclease M5)